MESLNVVTENYDLQGSVQHVLPMEITLSNEGIDTSSVLVQNYVIKRLDNGNLELIFCNGEDTNEVRYKQQSISDVDYISRQNDSFELDLEPPAKTTSNEFGVRSVEVPVIRNHHKDSVIQHASALTQKPIVPATTKNPSHPTPILSKPERVLLNITIYSCFKCNEQFNSLTLFRQHLKWHKAEKNFNCTKCSAGFNAENNLKIHMVTSHPGHHTDVCPICKIKFQRKASLKSHIMIHQIEEFFTCEECHGEFQNDEELLKHMEIHAVTRVTKTLSDSLVCPYCKLDFETLAEYKRHIEKHVEVKRNVLKGKKVRKKKPKEKPGGYKCKYCAKVFSKSGLLDRHERIHTGEKPYVCSFCKRAFAQKGTLQIHLGSHTGVKPYSCTLCQAKFTQKGNLRAHIDKTHTAPKGNQKIYRCMQCPCIFRKVASLNGHITKSHLNQDEKESELENIIDKVMGSLKMLNNELGKSALKKDEPRPSPPSPSKTAGMTCVRLAESHANGCVRRYVVRQKKIGDIRWYFCNFCSSRFKKPSDLIRHFRTHTLEKPYKCTKCNHAFSLKSTLINHYKIHDAPACHCSHCDIRIRNSRNFNAHVRSHEVKVAAPSYVCVLCDEAFFTAEEGKEHRAVHDEGGVGNIIEPILKQPLYETTYGSLPLKPPKPKIPNTGAESPLERPHHCKMCDARFTRLMSLKRHMFYHTGERKYRCSLCPKAFVTKYRLKEHVNYHKNIRNYGCQTCGQKFVTSSLLKRHTIVHNTHKPYLCPYCDKHFKTLLLCRAHIKTVHKLNVYLVNGEELPEDTGKIETVTSRLSENASLAVPSTSDENIREVDLSPKSRKDALSPTESTAVSAPQSSVILSVAPQENQQGSNPAYQMVYLNIGDLPVTNANGALSGNNMLSTLKIQNNSLLFNPLSDIQDPAVLFNIDANKSDMVDPNEVIKSSTSDYTSVISKTSQNKSNLGKLGDVATRRPEDMGQREVVEKQQALPNLRSLPEIGDLASGQQGVSLQEFSTVDLGGLPISIIGTEDAAGLSSNIVDGEININPNDMFYDAQVICINCHKIFSDMNVFQKHTCSQDLDTNIPGNLNLLLQENSEGNYHSEMMRDKAYSPRESLNEDDVSIKSTSVDVQTAENNQIDSMLRQDFPVSEDSVLGSDEFHFDELKKFKNKKPLLRDLVKLERSKVFRCKECNFFTTLEERYRKHMNYVHVQSTDKVCKFCFKDFKKVSDLVRHVRTHTGERPYECEKCHKKFSLKSTLESHMRTHEMSSTRKISCDVCNSNFATKSSLKVHMLLHTGARPYACTFCSQTFRTKAIRRAHEKNMHLGKVKQPPSGKTETGRKLLRAVAEGLADDVRNEKAASLGGARKDKEASVIQPKPEALILNSTQDAVTIDPVLLLQHLQNSGIILTADSEGTVPLNLNDITLLDCESLKVSGSDNNVNFIGNVGNFQYSHGSKNSAENRVEDGHALDSLQYVQENTPPREKEQEKIEPPPKQQKVVQKVECDICHKMYSTKDVLRRHKKNVHGQNKKFPCIKCDKGYDSLEELNKHIITLHTGIRPYACQYCANSFAEESNLKTHIKRIHQKSVVAIETSNAVMGLQFDLPMVPSDNSLL